MAQYDGSIRINTEIQTKQAKIQLATLENQMVKASDNVASLRSKLESLNTVQIPTQAYAEIQKQIEATEKKINDLMARQEKFLATGGKESSSAYQRMQYDLDELKKSLPYLKGELQDLIDSGKAFTLGDPEEIAKTEKELRYAENEMSVLVQKHELLEMKQKKNADGYKRLGDTAKKSLETIGNMLKKVNSHIDSFAKKIKEAAQKYLPLFRRETEKAKSALYGFNGRIKNLAMSLLIFNQISAAFRAASSAISAGFKNLYEDNERFRTSVDGLRASVLTLENAFAAAFRPVVDMAVPYIQKLVEWLTEAVNLAGQLFAALTGRKTYTRAIRQTAAASKEAAGAAKEEADAEDDKTDAIKKQLSPLDDLNNLTSEKADTDKKNKDDLSGAIASPGGTMFEEVPIDSGILDMVDKVKDIMSKLFAPLKEAWDREGKFVMDSWKYALDEVWKLVKDIGRDFLKVWQQPETVDIFADILHIIGDIGLVAGHLARNFREAWNENETGLHILENIRDIIGVIIHNIRLAADRTVEWADKLDFGPLLEAFERFTESLIPLGKWTLEEGLPKLLDVFTDFNNKVDWQALRENLAEFWRHLEPFAETVGEGLIIFIDRVSDALADFLNSQEFKDFLVMIEDWMDSVTPEDVADGLEKIVGVIIGLKVALLGYNAIKGFITVFDTIKKFAGGAKIIVSGIGSILSAIGSIPAILAMVAAAVAGWKIGEWINENLLGVDTPSFFEIIDGIKSSFTDGTWKEALNLWGEDIKAAWSEIWEWVKEDFNNSILGTILGSFTDGTWKEALKLWGDDIYNAFVTLGERQSEWLNSLKEKWSKTWSGIKEKVSGAIGSIKSTVGAAIDWIKSKLDSLKSSFNIGTGVAGSKLFGSRSTSYSTRSMPSPYAANPALMAAAQAPIPALARGAVIPPNREFLAVLGDQKHGTNIEALLETIEQANRKAILGVLSELGINGVGNSGQTLNLNLTVECEGYQLLHLMQKLDMEFFKQHGKHALT